jgi:hypothetical protein
MLGKLQLASEEDAVLLDFLDDDMVFSVSVRKLGECAKINVSSAEAQLGSFLP